MIGKLISGLVVGVRFLFVISGNRKVVNPDGEMLPNTRAGRWIAKVATVSPDRVKKWVITSFKPKLNLSSLGFKSARNLLLIWANFDPSRYFAERLEVFLSHTPAGTSFRNIIHFAQNIGKRGPVGGVGLAKLDYGRKSRNLEAYGRETPPNYDFRQGLRSGLLFQFVYAASAPRIRKSMFKLSLNKHYHTCYTYTIQWGIQITRSFFWR